jgi:hypothetical protein
MEAKRLRNLEDSDGDGDGEVLKRSAIGGMLYEADSWHDMTSLQC